MASKIEPLLPNLPGLKEEVVFLRAILRVGQKENAVTQVIALLILTKCCKVELTKLEEQPSGGHCSHLYI